MNTLTSADIAERIARETRLPVEDVVKCLSGLRDTASAEIVRGNAVVIDGLLTLQLSGKVAARPTGKQIGAPPKRKIAVSLDKEFREKIEGSRTYSIVLCVPVADMFTNIMVNSLTGPNSEVTVASGAEESQMQIQTIKPDLVLIDANLKEMPELIHYIKTAPDMPLTSIVVIFPEGANPHRIKGLRILEDDHVSEPFEMNDLIAVSEKQLQWIVENRGRLRLRLHFKFQTNEASVEKANELIGEILAKSGLSEEAADQLAVAYREAVDNAARHGNKNNPKRLIDTQLTNDGENVVIVVEDQGDGFDTEQYVSRGQQGDAAAAARERAKQGRVGGLGIMLMLKCVSRLEYNFKGNQVTLTKSLLD